MLLRAALLFLLPLSFLRADQIVLANGDKLTGTIVKKDGAKLTFKSEVFGEVTIPWSAVTSLTSSEPVTVVLPGGETVAGKVTTAGTSLEVAAPSGPKTAVLATVPAVRNPAEQRAWERLQHPGLLQLWAGTFDMGLALARGNARTDTLTTSFNASRISRKDKVTLYFNQIYGTARINGVTGDIASAIRGGWSYNRDITPRFFVAALNDYEHDRFQDLDLRFVIGGGFGANAIKTESVNLSLTGAADYSRTSFTGNLLRNSAELSFGDDLLWKVSGVTNVTQSFRIFPNLTYTGEYRLNFDLTAVTALKKWLGWHVTASDRFLTDPPFGRQRNDILLSTGFRLNFAK